MSNRKQIPGGRLAKRLKHTHRFIDQYPTLGFSGVTVSVKAKVRIATRIGPFLQIAREERSLDRVRGEPGNPENDRESVEYVLEVGDGIVLTARGPEDVQEMLASLPRPERRPRPEKNGPPVVQRRRGRVSR